MIAACLLVILVGAKAARAEHKEWGSEFSPGCVPRADAASGPQPYVTHDVRSKVECHVMCERDAACRAARLDGADGCFKCRLFAEHTWQPTDRDCTDDEDVVWMKQFVNPCDPGWSHFGDSCYIHHIPADSIDFFYAYSYCHNILGARLLMIETAEEQAFISATFLPSVGHCGLIWNTIRYSSGVWKLYYGNVATTYINWAPRQPDDLTSTYTYIYLNATDSYRWYDADGYSTIADCVVCEYQPL